MASVATAGSMLAARRRLMQEGRLAGALSGTPIARSWERCLGFGLDMTVAPAIEPMTAQELREAASPHERLRQISRAELDALRREAQRTGSVVILTDPDGMVLDSRGSADFAERAAQVALRPGVRWSEDCTGTNAIGTALFERRPIEVRGGEHYFQTHAILTCAAAPIFDPGGRIAGALDMSGSSLVDHRHALGLVRMAVEQIEHRFFDEGFGDAEVVRFHTDPDLLGTAREGILVFRQGRLVAANRHGLGLMRLDWSALETRALDDLFLRLPAEGGIGRSRRADSKPLFARLSKPASPRSPPRARLLAAGEPEPVYDTAGEAMLAKARRLADAGLALLVTGETGTGKEVFARRVHALGARSGHPFVAVNCAALPEQLIESELFGYTEGAFTGARRQGARGLVREAAGGILFLDEIGDMPLALQARLLRVLQDKQVKPLGGGTAVPVDFTLICATHRDLDALVKAGDFRADLYFRLAQYPFELPPLRRSASRVAAIESLIEAVVGGNALAPQTRAALLAHDWPGNFRQLVGVLKALGALGEPGVPIPPDLLPASIGPAAQGPEPPENPAAAGSLAALQREAIREALDRHGGNISHAARALGVHRSTLHRHLHQS